VWTGCGQRAVYTTRKHGMKKLTLASQKGPKGFGYKSPSSFKG